MSRRKRDDEPDMPHASSGIAPTVIDELVETLRMKLRDSGAVVETIHSLTVSPEAWCSAAELAGMYSDTRVIAGIADDDTVYAVRADLVRGEDRSPR